MQSTVAAVRLAELPVAAVRLREPDLAGRPVAVVRNGRVVCVDGGAEKAGVWPGAPENTLPAHVVSKPPATLEEDQLRGRVHEHLLNTTPLVEEVRPGLWLADLTGTRGVHRVPEIVTVGCTLEALEGLLGIPAMGGVGPNRVVALAAESATHQTPLQWIRVMPGQEARFLAPLPVTLLPGIGRALSRRLARLGIERMGHLSACSEERLVRAFGKKAARWREMARGIDLAQVLPGVRRSDPLLYDIAPKAHFQGDADLWRLFADACERLGEGLRREGQYATRLMVRFTYLDGEEAAGKMDLPTGTDRNAELLRAAWNRFERLLQRRVMVRHIHLSVEKTVSHVPLSLFPEEREVLPLSRPGLDEAVDHIRQKFGWETIRLARWR